MLEWQTVDEDAIWPHERYRAVRDNHKYRIFYGPEAAESKDIPWILVVQAVHGEAAHGHVHHGNYSTVDWAKRSAEQW